MACRVSGSVRDDFNESLRDAYHKGYGISKISSLDASGVNIETAGE